MRGNTVSMKMQRGVVGKAFLPLFQYDYGQRLILEGIELPETYEVHFSNTESGTSKTSIGDSTGVDIPDEYLTSGEPIYVWLFLHQGNDDGETEYKGIIQVYKRARPTDDPATPQQKSAISQAIALLNQTVENVGTQIQTSLQEAKDSGEFDGEKGDTGETGATPNFTIGTVTTGEAGSQASVTITGTPENPVLNLTIPKGDTGDLSASDIASTAQTQAIINEYEG